MLGSLITDAIARKPWELKLLALSSELSRDKRKSSSTCLECKRSAAVFVGCSIAASKCSEAQPCHPQSPPKVTEKVSGLFSGMQPCPDSVLIGFDYAACGSRAELEGQSRA